MKISDLVDNIGLAILGIALILIFVAIWTVSWQWAASALAAACIGMLVRYHAYDMWKIERDEERRKAAAMRFNATFGGGAPGDASK